MDTGGCALHEAHVHLCGLDSDDDSGRANPMHMIYIRASTKMERQRSGRSPVRRTSEFRSITLWLACEGPWRIGGSRSGYPYNGLNDWGPEAQALWNEIGRLGNEIQNRPNPLLGHAHPVSVPLTRARTSGRGHSPRAPTR